MILRSRDKVVVFSVELFVFAPARFCRFWTFSMALPLRSRRLLLFARRGNFTIDDQSRGVEYSSGHRQVTAPVHANQDSSVSPSGNCLTRRATVDRATRDCEVADQRAGRGRGIVHKSSDSTDALPSAQEDPAYGWRTRRNNCRCIE